MLKFSILDQCTAPQGRDSGAAMRETLAQARLAEDLGYHRYWLAEHHSNPGLVGATPEIMTTAVAMVTNRIRVGAAREMLPHYSFCPWIEGRLSATEDSY